MGFRTTLYNAQAVTNHRQKKLDGPRQSSSCARKSNALENSLEQLLRWVSTSSHEVGTTTLTPASRPRVTWSRRRVGSYLDVYRGAIVRPAPKGRKSRLNTSLRTSRTPPTFCMRTHF